MKTLYIECNMGASGDMFLGALLDLSENKAALAEKINAVMPAGVELSLAEGDKCGIRGTSACVTVDGEEEISSDVTGLQLHEHEHEHEHEHHHEHSSLQGIRHLIGHMELPEEIKNDALGIFQILGEAESRVHNRPVEEVHFHEVGSLDALCDIVGTCILMRELKPDKIIASAVHVGSGMVHCAHGLLPVPAPATAIILNGVPIYGGGIQGELCTPTGAALLKYYAAEFGPLPVMRLLKTGYGLGKKDFPAANCLRLLLGEAETGGDRITELACNLDDITAEELAFACGTLLREGALDVFTVPIYMKKNRAASMLVVLCRPEDEARMTGLMLRHTPTLGVRRCEKLRTTLRYEFETIETPYGSVRMKTAVGDGFTKSKPEFEDVKALAEREGLSLRDVYASIHEGLRHKPKED